MLWLDLGKQVCIPLMTKLLPYQLMVKRSDLPSTQTIDDRDMGGSIEVTSFGETETTVNLFTPAEVQLYQHRIEEGYNVFTDQRFVQCVNLNHPALLPASLSQHQISSPLIVTANKKLR